MAQSPVQAPTQEEIQQYADKRPDVLTVSDVIEEAVNARPPSWAHAMNRIGTQNSRNYGFIGQDLIFKYPVPICGHPWGGLCRECRDKKPKGCGKKAEFYFEDKNASHLFWAYTIMSRQFDEEILKVISPTHWAFQVHIAISKDHLESYVSNVHWVKKTGPETEVVIESKQYLRPDVLDNGYIQTLVKRAAHDFANRRVHDILNKFNPPISFQLLDLDRPHKRAEVPGHGHEQYVVRLQA